MSDDGRTKESSLTDREETELEEWILTSLRSSDLPSLMPSLPHGSPPLQRQIPDIWEMTKDIDRLD